MKPDSDDGRTKRPQYSLLIEELYTDLKLVNHFLFSGCLFHDAISVINLEVGFINTMC